MTVFEKGYAKLNLSLDVLGRRDDGYHEMLMVMQSVSLADELKVEVKGGSGGISVSTNKSYLPVNEKNLAYAAAREYLAETGITDCDVHIDIAKRIPVCAGMAGGSTDAAAVLRALDRALGEPLSRDRLFAAADRVGSDVGFCLMGGTALASGRGTRLKELEELSDCAFVVVKPGFSVSTPALFSKLDSVKIRTRPDTDGILTAIEAGDAKGVALRAFNIFESVLDPRERGKVEEAKGALIANGALGAAMTGTGSAIFGIFGTTQEAESAARALKAEYDECWSCVPSKSVY